MKLSFDDKLSMYELRKKGIAYSLLSQQYNSQVSDLKYMVRFMDRYGVRIVRKSKNSDYSPELKQEMLDKVLIDGHPQSQISF